MCDPHLILVTVILCSLTTSTSSIDTVPRLDLLPPIPESNIEKISDSDSLTIEIPGKRSTPNHNTSTTLIKDGSVKKYHYNLSDEHMHLSQ